MRACAFCFLESLESYDLRLPVDGQVGLRSGIVLPGTVACFCIDIDHQGKAVRYLYVKGGGIG